MRMKAKSFERLYIELEFVIEALTKQHKLDIAGISVM